MGSRLREAVEAFQRGDLEAALAMADAHADKAIPEWEHLIGLIECRRGNPKAGLIHLRAAARAQPDNPGFRLMLARALVDSGCADEVLEMDEAPTAPSPVNVALWQVCAEAAEKAQNASARTHAWRSIAAMTPIDQRAWLNLGRSLLQEENFTDAADAYRKALEIDPSNLEGLHELALVYERAGGSSGFGAFNRGCKGAAALCLGTARTAARQCPRVASAPRHSGCRPRSNALVASSRDCRRQARQQCCDICGRDRDELHDA